MIRVRFSEKTLRPVRVTEVWQRQNTYQKHEVQLGQEDRDAVPQKLNLHANLILSVQKPDFVPPHVLRRPVTESYSCCGWDRVRLPKPPRASGDKNRQFERAKAQRRNS